jgi:hypothetical protein
MSALFAFKLTLVPFFILALSLAGRRWGTAVSGWLVALPVVAGPIVFFIGVEQGEAFAAGAARATIAGLASLAVYSLVYCRLALRVGWVPSLLAGWAGFFLSTYLLNRLPLTLPHSIALALFALAGAYLLLPGVGSEGSPPATPSWEIAARMAAAVGMVLLMTALARPLGPHLAGLLVPFPVAGPGRRPLDDGDLLPGRRGNGRAAGSRRLVRAGGGRRPAGERRVALGPQEVPAHQLLRDFPCPGYVGAGPC